MDAIKDKVQQLKELSRKKEKLDQIKQDIADILGNADMDEKKKIAEEMSKIEYEDSNQARNLQFIVPHVIKEFYGPEIELKKQKKEEPKIEKEVTEQRKGIPEPAKAEPPERQGGEEKEESEEKKGPEKKPINEEEVIESVVKETKKQKIKEFLDSIIKKEKKMMARIRKFPSEKNIQHAEDATEKFIGKIKKLFTRKNEKKEKIKKEKTKKASTWKAL